MPHRWPWGRPDPQVALLSRAGCHLCEQMDQVVRPMVPSLQVLDIDAERAAGRMDPAAHDRWTTQVPVLLIDGEPVARWRVKPQQVQAALRSAKRRAGRRSS